MLAIEGAGPPAVLDVVNAAGVPVVRLTDQPTADGVLQRIRAVAKAVDSNRKANYSCAKRGKGLRRSPVDGRKPGPLRGC